MTGASSTGRTWCRPRTNKATSTLSSSAPVIVPIRWTTNTGIEDADLADVTDNCLQEGSDCGLDLTTGWKLQMESLGEKILATPLTISGSVFFTSYIPPGASAETACTPTEGGGKLYAISLQTAAAVINYDTSDDPNDPDGGRRRRRKTATSN
jgi:Tfp pilus tip-associated adhesin PilY1